MSALTWICLRAFSGDYWTNDGQDVSSSPAAQRFSPFLRVLHPLASSSSSLQLSRRVSAHSASFPAHLCRSHFYSFTKISQKQLWSSHIRDCWSRMRWEEVTKVSLSLHAERKEACSALLHLSEASGSKSSSHLSMRTMEDSQTELLCSLEGHKTLISTRYKRLC